MKKTLTAIPWIAGIVISVGIFALLILGLYLFGKSQPADEPVTQSAVKR